MDILFPYTESKIKPYLKMAVQRLQIAKNKKVNLSKHSKREIANLLRADKEEMARIKAEHIVREDFTIEAYEMLELLCELLHERIRLITNSSKEPPSDLMEAISGIVWASTRIDNEELQVVRKQLAKKFGQKFIKSIIDNSSQMVNPRLLRKLSADAPSAKLVQGYMSEIAKEFNIDWEPTDIGVPESGSFQSPVGFSIPMAPGTNLTSVYQNSASVLPPLPSTDSTSSNLNPPSESSSSTPFQQSSILSNQSNNFQQLAPQSQNSSVVTQILHAEVITEHDADIPIAEAKIVNNLNNSVSSNSDNSNMVNNNMQSNLSTSLNVNIPSSLPTHYQQQSNNPVNTEDNDSFENLQARLAALRK